MGSQYDARGPSRGGGPIDEEARWQAYQAWLRKKRGGLESAAHEPPPVPVAAPAAEVHAAEVSYPPARTALISIAALGIAGAMIGGISLLALGHAPTRPAIVDASVRSHAEQAAKLSPVAAGSPLDVGADPAAVTTVAATPAAPRIDDRTVSEAPTARPSPVRARVRRRHLTPMEAYARRRRLTPMEAYARAPPAAIDPAQ
jgi:hypothetical protein